jgi:hypothetical protein
MSIVRFAVAYALCVALPASAVEIAVPRVALEAGLGAAAAPAALAVAPLPGPPVSFSAPTLSMSAAIAGSPAIAAPALDIPAPSAAESSAPLVPPVTVSWAKAIHLLLASPAGAATFADDEWDSSPLYFQSLMPRALNERDLASEEHRQAVVALDPIVILLKADPAVPARLSEALDAIDRSSPAEERTARVAELMNGLASAEVAALVARLKAAELAAPALMIERARQAYKVASVIQDPAKGLQAARFLERQLFDWGATWANIPHEIATEYYDEARLARSLRKEKERQLLSKAAAEAASAFNAPSEASGH